MLRPIALAWAVLGVMPAQNKAPQKTPDFTDYPIASVFHGTPAAPKFSTSGQRRYRTMIRQAAAKGANFAGHYAVAEWGCGTGCLQMAVVDLQSGDVYEAPFGALPEVSVYLGVGNEGDNTGIFFHPDSELFVVVGCPNYRQPGAYYYRWSGSKFTLLRRIPMKPWLGCES